MKNIIVSDLNQVLPLLFNKVEIELCNEFDLVVAGQKGATSMTVSERSDLVPLLQKMRELLGPSVSLIGDSISHFDKWHTQCFYVNMKDGVYSYYRVILK